LDEDIYSLNCRTNLLFGVNILLQFVINKKGLMRPSGAEITSHEETLVQDAIRNPFVLIGSKPTITPISVAAIKFS
jgi:hypothetical protein